MAKRWIAETFHPDWRPAIRADKILHEVKTDHQHLVIFENTFWGKVLILDGVFQLTTRDEYIYHEMISHVPLMALERPRKVLIIGGGDGGVLREVLKHPSVQQATLVEIDQQVVDTSLKYYPEIGRKAFRDKRANIVIADGCKYVAETTERFDAIIVDSSEPMGPSAVLHSKAFFADCKRALKNGGIFVTQNSLPFHTPQHLAATTKALGSLYKTVAPYVCTHPSYFGGEFCLNWASDNTDHLAVPTTTIAHRASRRGISTKYWTPAYHTAAFALPGYIEKIVARAQRKPTETRNKTR
ncbi:MAG: polyamine aminopropyltransferase [Hyphomicrobiaceae bacterium]